MAKPTPTASPQPTVSYDQVAQDLLNHIQVPGTVTVIDSDEILQFQIDTDSPGLLIGYHGETLSAFQRILGMILEKQTGSWHSLTVNVGDYRERREESLKNLAMTTAQRVKFSGESAILPALSAADRRVIHMLLTDHPDVITESEGEGLARHLVVKPRNK